jgi:two-component system LytT family response regulator
MTVRCIIVDDEPLARDRLVDYVGRLPQLLIAGAFETAHEAVAFLLTCPVDLMFLDINLGGMSGLELLETSVVRCPVVLTTAHPDYALRAYDLRVADYLLKPFSFARFFQSVERARGLSMSRAGPNDRQYLFVKTELRLERLRLSEVLYIEGDRDYRCIHTLSKDIMTLETFGDLEQRIPSDQVCRVHKSFMVALDKIESIARDRIAIGRRTIPISASYRERFYALIGHHAQ